jgi:hypothetical protein
MTVEEDDIYVTKKEALAAAKNNPVFIAPTDREFLEREINSLKDSLRSFREDISFGRRTMAYLHAELEKCK